MGFKQHATGGQPGPNFSSSGSCMTHCTLATYTAQVLFALDAALGSCDGKNCDWCVAGVLEYA